MGKKSQRVFAAMLAPCGYFVSGGYTCGDRQTVADVKGGGQPHEISAGWRRMCARHVNMCTSGWFEIRLDADQ